MIRYKLTNQDMQTYNGYQWTIGEKKRTDGSGELCGPGWLHVYTDPRLALLLNPIHANIKDPRLFECECSGECKTDKGLKEGWTEVTLTRELSIPEITSEQRVEFAIRCALEVYHDPSFVEWASKWLSGKDRSAAAAEAAWAAAWAARAAEAWAAARAAEAAEAWAAARAARAAAWAAKAAARADFDLITIVDQVIPRSTI